MADAGPLTTDVVFPAIEAFGDAFRLMVRHRHTQVTGHRPPYPALLAASALRLAAVDAGSGAATLEIAGPMELGKLADAPREGLTALLAGAAADLPGLPKEASFPLRRIVDGLPEGINSVAIAVGAGPEAPAVTLTREMFDDGLPQRETFHRHGRLEEVNWVRGTAVLGTWHGICLLVFPPSLADTMRQAADRLISIAGAGERTPDGVTIIREIEAIDIAEEKGNRLKGWPPGDDDVRQALAIVRWEEKQREWFYDDELDAFVDAIQNRKYKDQ